MILIYAIIAFVIQILWMGARTWNIKAIANNNIPQALLSNAVIFITWCINIAVGVDSTLQVLKFHNWNYLPVLVSSLIGGTIGCYLSLIKNKEK